MPTSPTRPIDATEENLRVLTATHAEMLVQLAALRDLVEDADRPQMGQDVKQRARELVSFFASNARAHHAEEERHIFPALLRDGSASTVDMVNRLQQDHGWLEEDWIELAPMLEALAAGSSQFDPVVLRPAVEVFSSLYLEHIELEDGQAYPQARELMRLLERGPERVRRQNAA